MSYQNYVEGSKSHDNKQSGNKRKTSSNNAHQGETIHSVQNSKEHTPSGVGQKGNKNVRVHAKRAKSLNTQNIYADGAIKMAQRMRGA